MFVITFPKVLTKYHLWFQYQPRAIESKLVFFFGQCQRALMQDTQNAITFGMFVEACKLLSDTTPQADASAPALTHVLFMLWF